MTVLRQTLRHPANEDARTRALLRWITHNVRRRIHPRRDIVVTLLDGCLLGPTDHPVINSCVYASEGFYDWDAFHALQQLLDPGDWFIDVGANIGVYSVIAAQLITCGGQIWAFEPARASARYLERNLSTDRSDVRIFEVALGSAPSTSWWDPSLGTTAHLAGGDQGAPDLEPVTVTTLDAILDSTSTAPTSFSRSVAKIDVEGWEPAVVAGAKTWLAGNPRALLIEAAGHSHRCDVPWDSLVETLTSHGYRFVWPERRTTTLHLFDADRIAAHSPFHDYFAVNEEGLSRLAARCEPRPFRE